MCEPITAAIASISSQTMMAASLGLSALTGAVNYASQKAQADSSAAYAQQSRDSAVQSMLAQNHDLNAREQQETASAALRKEDARRKARSAASTANATSEAAGLSYEALLADYDRQYLSYADAQMQQLGFQTDQIDRTREGLQAQAESRTNSAYSQVVAQPSIGGTLLGFGADALGTVQRFQVRDPFTGHFTI